VRQIVAFGICDADLAVKQGDLYDGELETLRNFTADRAFDMVALPGMRRRSPFATTSWSADLRRGVSDLLRDHGHQRGCGTRSTPSTSCRHG
jgi:hypothetical protein